MKRRVVTPGRMIVVLFLLAVLVACQIPSQQAEEPPADALSHDQLLANLDALQSSATRSLTQPGKSLFSVPGGAALSSQDLSAYLNAIKKDVAGYVYACMGGSPYLVVPKKVTWTSQIINEGVPTSVTESGLMWVPFTWGWPRKFPVISYQHGTQGYERCAPSRFNANPFAALGSPDVTGALQNYVECIVGALMASAGYIVVMPDYVGFGDSTLPDHPYVTLSLGNSVLGILARAQALLASSAVKPNGKIFLTGYSEGGYATMAGALALQKASIPVIATVPCDGAYSLSGVMLDQMLDQTVLVPSYLLYTASGYHALYGPAIDYDTLLEDPYDDLLDPDRYFDGTHTNAEIAALSLLQPPGEMLQPAAKTDLENKTGTVFGLLTQNDAWVGWAPVPLPSPVYFVHCPEDDVVPYKNATEAQANLPAGVPSYIRDVPALPFVDTLLGSKHVAAYPPAMLAAFMFINSLK